MKSLKRGPRLQRIIDLQEFLLHFRSIDRQLQIKKADSHINENDVEHSYSLAMIAWFIVQSFPKLNKDLVIRYALAHDLVEVYAGDTYIFANPAELKSKVKRERAAARKIRNEWFDFPDMNQAIEGYEKLVDNESKFIYALDKITPIIINILSEGYTWHIKNVSLEQMHAQKIDKVSISDEIKPYYDQLYEFLLVNEHLFPKKLKKGASSE